MNCSRKTITSSASPIKCVARSAIGLGRSVGRILLTLVWVAALPWPSWAGEVSRPNILWLVSEDNDRLLGCYGDPLARTPTLDRLASKGVLFERCFGWPVCAPSRFTLITGMYAAGCGPAEHMRAQGNIPDWLKGFHA